MWHVFLTAVYVLKVHCYTLLYLLQLCRDISCWAIGNVPTDNMLSEHFLLRNRKYPDNVFCCRDISCWPKMCRNISCCPAGNIPTAFFCVGIFPVGQLCRDISFWHNVGIFPIGCVGTSTFPQFILSYICN
jgi:hypothetical protein